MKRTLVVVIILAIACLLGWQVYRRLSLSRGRSANLRSALAVAVEVAPVRRATIRDIKLFAGSLLPKSYFVVAPKVAGRLEKLLVDIGDTVREGQLIAVLDDEESLQNIGEARAELEVAKATVVERQSSLEVGRREFERAQALWQKKIISESELENARAAYEAQEAKYKVALAQVAQKEAALKAAMVRLSYTKIQASWEGGGERRIIGERFVDDGAMLKANDPIVSILDIGFLTGVIHVIERDYPRLRVGQEAIVDTDAFPSRTFAGKVIRVAPLLKETSREAKVEIEIPNPEGLLKPGMFVRVRIEFSKKDNATVVPMSALVRRNRQQGVFLVDNQNMKAHFVPVTLGIVDREFAEVAGPSLSGFIVTLGHHLLEDGSSIILPKPEMESHSSQQRTSVPSVAGEKTQSRAK